MAERRPIVLSTGGEFEQLPTGDTLPGSGGATVYGSEAQLFHIVDEKPSGTAGGGNIAGIQTRTLNKIRTNEITGASLSANEITLPAGDYWIQASAVTYRTDHNVLFLKEKISGTFLIEGMSCYANPSTGYGYPTLSGKISIAVETTFTLEMYALTAYSTYGFGVEVTAVPAAVEIYADIQIWKQIAVLTTPVTVSNGFKPKARIVPTVSLFPTDVLYNAGASTFVEDATSILLSDTANSGETNRSVKVKDITGWGTEWQIITEITAEGTPDVYDASGLTLVASNNEFITVGPGTGSSSSSKFFRILRWNADGTYASTVYNASGSAGDKLVSISRSGSTLTFSTSVDGFAWTVRATETIGGALADVTEIGISASKLNAVRLTHWEDPDTLYAAITTVQQNPITMINVNDPATSRTITNGDLSGRKIFRMTAATPVILTVNAGLIGTEFATFIQKGAGTLSFVAGAGVTIESPDAMLKTRVQFSSLSLIPEESDIYQLVGDLKA